MNFLNFQFQFNFFFLKKIMLNYLNIKSLLYDCIDLSYQNPYIFVEYNFEINGCDFKRISLYSGSGGVISLSSKNINMKLENSQFFNCSATSTGGAIYFENTGHSGSNSILSKICASHCFSNYRAQFARIAVYNQLTNWNQYHFVSVYKCSPFYDHTQRPICSNGGNHTIKNFNSSNNLCRGHSGLIINMHLIL